VNRLLIHVPLRSRCRSHSGLRSQVDASPTTTTHNSLPLVRSFHPFVLSTGGRMILPPRATPRDIVSPTMSFFSSQCPQVTSGVLPILSILPITWTAVNFMVTPFKPTIPSTERPWNSYLTLAVGTRTGIRLECGLSLSFAAFPCFAGCRRRILVWLGIG
jgi:hypothetical protein